MNDNKYPHPDPDTELLSGIHKLSQTGIEAVEAVIHKAQDDTLKQELLEQYADYCRASSDTKEALCSRGVEAKSLNPMEKALMWGSVQLHTLNQTSPEHIAEIMINGTTKGIIDLSKHIGACKNADPEIIDYAEGFISKEEKHIDNLKSMLY